MAGEWRETILGDVLTLQRGFDLPETQRRPGPHPVIASTGPVGTHDQAVVQGPGVVIGRSGSLGGGQFIESDFWPLNTTLWVKDFKGNDRRFCYYLLKSLDLAHFNAGSGVPTLNRNHIHPLPVRVPTDRSEQRAIAYILGTFDDKIELNRRMNETLEAMARALFKSWFVDFDPVRAKAEGREPALPKHIADLFPASFVDSELGEIPEGCEVRTLGDLLELAYGKALKADDRRDGDVPVYGSNGQVGWHDRQLVQGPGIVVGRKGNPGVVKWAPIDFFVIDTAFYVVPKETCRNLQFLFHALKTHDLGSLGADSAVPGLNRNLAYMSAQVLPPPMLLERFEACAGALAVCAHACSNEARTLASLRDALLPKMLSGEIRVKEAVKFAAKVT